MSKIANNLIHKGYLKTDIIIDAFSEIDRTEFVSDRFRIAASSDIPLSLGHGQIMPEPSVIAFMLELLQPSRGQDVLVVGFGGGWIVAMMSYIVGSGGSVFAVDVLNDLKNEAIHNINKYNFIARDNIAQLKVIANCEDLPKNKKYNRIIVINPDLWTFCDFRNFLTMDGIMVAPIDNIIYYFRNRPNDDIVEERFDSMKFLPT